MSQSADSAPKWTPYFTRSGPLPDATPLELVAQARKQLDAGDDRQWAGNLWAAVRLTFLDLAARHDLASEDFIADAKAGNVDDDEYIPIAKTLDEIKDLDASGAKRHPRHYRLALGSGLALRDHQQIGIFKEYWWEGSHESAGEFIDECYDAVP